MRNLFLVVTALMFLFASSAAQPQIAAQTPTAAPAPK
jgi:hypothetical protein